MALRFFSARRRRAVPLRRHWMRHVDVGLGVADHALVRWLRVCYVVELWGGGGVEGFPSALLARGLRVLRRFGAMMPHLPQRSLLLRSQSSGARLPGALWGSPAVPTVAQHVLMFYAGGFLRWFADCPSCAPHPPPLLSLHLLPVNSPSCFSFRLPHPALPPGHAAHQARYGSVYSHASV